MNAPFPDQMLAAPALLAYVIVKVWRPLAADVLALLVVGLLLAVGGWLIDRGSARITAHRQPRDADDDFDRIVRHFNDPFPADADSAEDMPGVTHLGPTPPPPGRRRMPRIPGRPRRRNSLTSSTADRRHHS